MHRDGLTQDEADADGVLRSDQDEVDPSQTLAADKCGSARLQHVDELQGLACGHQRGVGVEEDEVG